MLRPIRLIVISAALGLLLPAEGAFAQLVGEQHPQASTVPGGASAAELLDGLFGRLRGAKDEKSAEAIELAIWKLWGHSGSPTTDALLQQAEKAMEAEQLATAISILDTAVELRPEFPEVWNKRATAHFLNRQFDRSIADIERVLALEPRHFGALAGLGAIRREMGDERGALDAFRRALAIHPHLKSARQAVKQLELQVEQDI
jgi:tetratricopeptide (TPR) repeat protein